MNEKDVQIIMKHPLVMIGTDGIDFGSKPHPRAWGTYPRILEHYVKNNNVITLEQAINKMTLMPAEKFNIKNRGLIKENYFADLVIIDLSNLKDNSTFTNPKNPPDGIDYIFVNGKKSIEKGKELNVFSGMTVKNNV